MFAKESKKLSDLSDLAKIEEVVDHPVELFRIWRDEAHRYNATLVDICCLSTVSKLVLTISIIPFCKLYRYSLDSYILT